VATECGSVTDNDCVPGLSDGTGPGLVINANLFEGNSADAGSGGGLRLQAVNGADVPRFPSQPKLWYHVQVQNNIINNNVAGWDGAGVSLEDALAVTLINNTISSNDTTASAGTLFNTLGAPLASSQSPAPTCISASGGTVSCPQPAGLVSMQNSPQLTSSFTTGAISCPPGNFAGTSGTNGTCIHISYPALYNNLFWQNRSFQIGVGSLGTGAQNQQNVVSLYNAAFTGGLGSAP
jgi:parallel beta-helix repeat protein